MLAAVFGAIIWNLITWWLGLPSSSSHALIGGLVGAALAQSGVSGVQWHGLAHKVLIPALWSRRRSRSLGGFLLLLAIYWLFQRLTPGVGNRSFRIGQLFSGTWMAFTHGANDAQKTMGVIALALLAEGKIDHFYIPTWVKIAAGRHHRRRDLLGRLADHAHRRQRIYQMEPSGGFASQATAGIGHLRLDESGLSALDHPRGLRRRDRLRRDEAALGRSLGRRGEHRHRVGADDPRRGRDGRCLLLRRVPARVRVLA